MIESLILMHQKSDRGPGKAVRRRALDTGLAEPIQTFNGSLVRVFRQRKKRYCRCIDVRIQSGSKDDPIAGVPSAFRARPVAQHLRSQVNSIDDLFGTKAGERLF